MSIPTRYHKPLSRRPQTPVDERCSACRWWFCDGGDSGSGRCCNPRHPSFMVFETWPAALCDWFEGRGKKLRLSEYVRAAIRETRARRAASESERPEGALGGGVALDKVLRHVFADRERTK